ncbi:MULTISPECIES: alpha/beta hydrolase [unclassified Sphingomonas]|uniref:alpha/beta hydrolase n=1 Tax=unclassified Sphingomonas TaxID=196159 RepID=UPI000BCCCBC3|nr:MAG: lipase [Sphingomonas sp. 32-62-10]
MTEHFTRPDVAMFLAFLNALPGPKTHELPPAMARAMYVASKDAADLPVGELAVVRDLSAPGPAGEIPLRLFDSRADRPASPALVFYHGGGFVIGDLDTHAGICAEMARQLDLPVIAVDYRLAPEHPFPAATDDCEAATRWIASSPAELGFSVTGLVLSGDSAGGNLTIVTAMALRDSAAAVPVIAQFPIYPTVDRADAHDSYELFGEGRLLTKDGMKWFDEAYAATPGDWRAAPLHANHRDMPPTLVITAGLDPLRDQGRAYAAALIANGVPTVYREATGNIHGFVTLRKAIPSAQAEVDGALAVLKGIIAEAVAVQR